MLVLLRSPPRLPELGRRKGRGPRNCQGDRDYFPPPVLEDLALGVALSSHLEEPEIGKAGRHPGQLVIV